MKVINLVGGPGCGKSTTAAGLFYELKRRDYSVELVTEYAKSRVWEDSLRTLNDQIYVFGKQQHMQWKLLGNVDYVITDTSLLFGLIDGGLQVTPAVEELVTEDFKRFDNICYFLKRDGVKFEQSGRIQNLEASEKIDKDLIELMNKHEIPFIEVPSVSAVEDILGQLIGK